MKGGKAPTAEQQRWQDWQREQGCYFCKALDIDTLTEIHHAIGSTGKHQKVWIGQWWTLPLCTEHHTRGDEAIHKSPKRKELEKSIFDCLVSEYRLEGYQFPEEVRRLVMGYHV